MGIKIINPIKKDSFNKNILKEHIRNILKYFLNNNFEYIVVIVKINYNDNLQSNLSNKLILNLNDKKDLKLFKDIVMVNFENLKIKGLTKVNSISFYHKNTNVETYNKYLNELSSNVDINIDAT